ncbi:MAG: hypothetical protein GF364_04170 [Candidatus Lokiarchaeota archaeon]|nr:hypothetical protein [Candidatus Lokiarchaeota archaeon]
MVEALVIIAWRNDVGAYMLDSIPSDIEIDEQNLMNLYNLHRFRDTQANFQFITTQDFRIASFYSGGYNSPYVGKPNYAVAAILAPGEKPDDYEKPLRKICNNLLIRLEDAEFDMYFHDMYKLLRDNKFDEIKIDRKKGAGPKPKEIETTTSISEKIKKTEEKDLFDDLLATVSDEEVPDDLKFDEEAFRKSVKENADPFGSNASTSGSQNAIGTAESAPADPFAGASPVDKIKQVEKKTPKLMSPKVKISTSKLVNDLKKLEERMPNKPSSEDPEKIIKYLERKVNVFEKMLSLVSKIAGQLQNKERELDQKNELISKLLLLLS